MRIMCLVLSSICLLCCGTRAEMQAQETDNPLKPIGHPTKFTEYNYAFFEDEKPFLDNLAIALQYQSEKIAYITVYAGKRAYLNEAQAHGKLINQYLVEERGIAVERVVWKDGGHRETATVEIWVWPPGIGEPSVTPDPNIKEVEIIKGCKSGKQKGKRRLER